MYSFPPPPHPPPPTVVPSPYRPLTPPPGASPPHRKQTHVASKHGIINKNLLYFTRPNLDKSSSFRQPRPRRTNPAVWCGAVICLIFSLVLILFGVTTLILFLNVRPKTPSFDAPNASLGSAYVGGSPEYYLNGDFTLLANFTNPNRKIDVRFEQLDIELYFADRLIATEAVAPFSQRRGETRLESVRMVSSLVYLPRSLAVELQKQVVSDKVSYNVRGTFKVRTSMGLVHYSYWLHARCHLEMTSPPAGVLVARSCTTKR